MAAYPNTIKYFTTKHNITDVVDESHPNDIQDEITAIETVLGTQPQISAYRATTYGSVDLRLEAMETDYRLKTDHDTHGALLGLTGDDHTQYLRTDGSRAPTAVGAMTAAPSAIVAGGSNTIGANPTLSRSDHIHGLAAAAPGASAVGDAAAAGTATSVARSDHVHAREAFGAVTAATTYGVASANGTAATVARSDHTHGTPSLSAVAPVTQAMGDAAAVGVGTVAARSDHTHGMPGFGAVTAATTFGVASANGSAVTVARSDHNHGTPSLGSTVTDERTWGITPSAGAASTASRSDHTHGSPDPTLQGPSGVLAVWPTATPPGGWLLCNGQAVSRTTYSVLFGLLGTTYGAGDGTTTFNVPDIRGRVVLGSGTGTGLTARTLGSTGGAETVALAAAEMPSHSHTVAAHSHSAGNEATHTHGTGDGGDHGHSMYPGQGWTADIVTVSVGGPQNAPRLVAAFDPNGTGPYITFGHTYPPGNHNHGGTGAGSSHSHSIGNASPGTDAQGSNSAHNNMQPWMALNWIIKT